MLFNLDQDLGEQNDVAGKHAERTKSMVAALNRWKEDVGEPAE